MTYIVNEDDSLMHYGVKRRSGRYPWGSGENPYQDENSTPLHERIQELRKSGMTEKQAADALGMTIAQMRARRAISINQERAAKSHRAYELKQKGYSNVKIAEIMGLSNESSVRSLLDPSAKARQETATIIADNLKKTIGKDNAVQIGKNIERHLGVSQDKLKVAVAMLEDEGYKVHHLYIDQLGTGHKTDVKVLGYPGSDYKEFLNNFDKVKFPTQSLDEPHADGVGFKKPVALDSKRLGVVYAEDGGTERDGTMLIRPGASDLELGNSRYAQVRINVDDSHYLKGMAMYGDPKDFPAGKDIVFYTNKKKGTPLEGTGDQSVLKPLKRVKNADGTKGDIDWDNPFGAAIKAVNGEIVGQYDYIDPKTGKKKQSLINKVNEEGDWSKWSKNLPSQFLSKQDVSLAKRQLGIELDKNQRTYDEIMAYNNPVVRKKLLKEFSDECDSAAVHMKAAAMPRQRTQVILPIPSLKDDEIFAPNFRDGEKVILVRFPHGGKFEIPELKVNNKNKDAIAALSKQAKDCVAINSKVAERLSGADFDGDNVLVIPNPKGEIKTHASLAGLKNFDPKTAYPSYPGMKKMTKKQKGKEMGVVSNLITDMTIKGAPWSDIEKAVRHSMVVIDAEKHELNWKQSEIDNQIELLKEKWQKQPSGKYGGASTLISKTTSTLRVPERKARSARNGGPINPETGEREWEYTGRKSYIPKKSGGYKEVPKQTVTTKGFDAKDLRTLSSGSEMESVYADYGNSMKALANKARLSYLNTPGFKYDPQANKKYATQVKSLDAKLNEALKNSPLEARAQLVANQLYKAKKEDHPEYDADDLKKLRNRCLSQGRAMVGAKKQQVYITDDEWEAIQHRAISASKLSTILDNANSDRIKELAMPKKTVAMTASMISRAKSMLARGYSYAEVADRLGVSASTLHDNL